MYEDPLWEVGAECTWYVFGRRVCLRVAFYPFAGANAECSQRQQWRQIHTPVSQRGKTEFRQVPLIFGGRCVKASLKDLFVASYAS